MIQSCFNVILKTKTILLGLLCFHLCLPRPLPCPKLPQLPSIVFYWDQLLLGMYLCYGAMLFNPSQTLHPSSFITRLNDLIRWLANPSMQWLKPWLNTSALSVLNAKHRERLLWASGGLVDVAKCLCCILLWSFDSKGRATMVDMADMIPKLTVTKGNNFIPVLRA